MNKVLEIQKFIINSASNIDYMQKNRINIFATVPLKIKMPYIKISGLTMNDSVKSANIKSFIFDLFVATNGKNNSQILEIMENLSSNLEEELYKYINENNEQNVNILHVYDMKYSISENLQNNFWNGHFYVNIDFI